MSKVANQERTQSSRLFRPLSLFAGSVATLTDPKVPRTHFMTSGTSTSTTNLNRPNEYHRYSQLDSTFSRPARDDYFGEPRIRTTNNLDPTPRPYIPTAKLEPVSTVAFASNKSLPSEPTAKKDERNLSKSLCDLPRANEPVIYRTGQLPMGVAERGRSHEHLQFIPKPLPMYQPHTYPSRNRSPERPIEMRPEPIAEIVPEKVSERPLQTSIASSAHDLSLGASAHDVTPSRKALEDYMLRLERQLQQRGRFLVDREQWLNLCQTLDETKNWFKSDERRKTPEEYEQRLQILRRKGDAMEQMMREATDAINAYEDTLRRIRDVMDNEKYRGKSLSLVQIEKLQQLVADHEEWLLTFFEPAEDIIPTTQNVSSLEYFKVKHKGLKESYEEILRTPSPVTSTHVTNEEPRIELLKPSSVTSLSQAAYHSQGPQIGDEDLSIEEIGPHRQTVPSENSVLEESINQGPHHHPTSTDIPGSTTSTLNPGSRDSSNNETPISEFFSTPDESFHHAIRDSQRSTLTREELPTATSSITILRPYLDEQSQSYTHSSRRSTRSGEFRSYPLSPPELYNHVVLYEQAVSNLTHQLLNTKYEVYSSTVHDTTKLNYRLREIHEQVRNYVRFLQYTRQLRNVLMDAENELIHYKKYRVKDVTAMITSVKEILQSATDGLNENLTECIQWLEEKGAAHPKGTAQVYTAARDDLLNYQNGTIEELRHFKAVLNEFLANAHDIDQMTTRPHRHSKHHSRTYPLPRVILQSTVADSQPTRMTRSKRRSGQRPGESLRIVEF